MVNQHKSTNNKKDTTNKQREYNDAGMAIEPIDITQDDWRLSILAELNLLPYGENKDIKADQPQMAIMNTRQPIERKQDLIKQKLDMAAARRHQIKEMRLREQLDTALFETIQLLRQQEFERRENHASVVADSLILPLGNESTIVQGIDPEIVATATGIATTAGSLFAAINRFEAISDDKIVPHPMDAHVEFGLTANIVSTAVMSNQDRKKREKSGMQKKQLQRMAVKRRIREKRFHQRKVAQDKAKTRHENASFMTFTGNWSGSGKYIKGRSRRSTRPYYTQLAACEKVFVVSVDEYKSIITCSSCFQRTTKQTQIRDGKVRGSFNPRCSRRISTSNRDRIRATNIAMIGFSSLVSENGPSPTRIPAHTVKQVSTT
ncbi:hypothetical protein [Parasitella parasitica]|uniref:Uncharacterized protein n=1 Tax=Parasitella parasitica TaxID=35722 RepID=A0A0B7NSA8_9FUNG|nr:hypothetical protein [Parasitella parasitica]